MRGVSQQDIALILNEHDAIAVQSGESTSVNDSDGKTAISLRVQAPMHTATRRQLDKVHGGALASTTPEIDTTRNQVFISYSHKDKTLLDDLVTHLKPFARNGSVTHWSDQQIAAGSKWFGEIQAALAKTKVALLLVTRDFLASDFIHDHELGPLLKQAEVGGVTILWVLVGACSYEETQLTHYQAVVSPPSKPLARMKKPDRDAAWVQICQEIKKAANQ